MTRPKHKPTAREQVRAVYPNAGVSLSVMHGWQIVDYGPGGYERTVLGSSQRSESNAWQNAARRLPNRRRKA